MAMPYNNLGDVYMTMENYDKALECFEHAWALYQPGAGGELPSDAAYTCTNLGFAYDMRGEYDKGLGFLERALAMHLQYHGENHPQTAKAYDDLGQHYYHMGDCDRSIEYLNHGLALRQALLGPDHGEVANSLNNLGLAYDCKGDYDRAVDYYQQSARIYLSNDRSENPFLATLYSNLSSTYHHKGDLDQAVGYGERALAMRLRWFGEQHSPMAYSYNNLAQLYEDLGDTLTAIRYFERSLAIFRTVLGEDCAEVATVCHNFGVHCAKSGLYAQALEYFHHALDIQLKTVGPDHPFTALTISNIAVCTAALGDITGSLDNEQQALTIRLKTFGAIHPEVAASYRNLGDFYQKSGAFDRADTAYVNALKALNYQTAGSFKTVNSAPALLHTLGAYAAFERHRYQAGGDTAWLLASHRLYREAIAVLDEQFKRLGNDSRYTLAAFADTLLSAAAATNLLLQKRTGDDRYAAESFGFAERAKGFVLYEALREAQALHVAGIPDSLLQREHELQIEAAFLDRTIQEKRNAGLGPGDSLVLTFSNRLFDVKTAAGALQKRFEQEFPDYHAAKYALPTASIAYIQDTLLEPGRCLLEYLVGDSSIFLYLVKTDALIVRQVPKDFPLEQWVETLTRGGIYGYYALPDSLQTRRRLSETIAAYTQTAAQLYEKLWAPVAADLDSAVIVIPDGVLGYVPFEALLTGMPAQTGVFADYPFLLKTCRISYCYSATLLREMRNKQYRHAPSKPLLALAPFAGSEVAELLPRVDSADLEWASRNLRDGLRPLPASGGEVSAVAKTWGGTAWYGAEATMAAFLSQAPDYRILHLSTHGKADDRLGDYAYLAFATPGEPARFDKLFARDLYNLRLHADLVVLSACETGIGKWKHGEGIVSLARAFAYAGAKSIVTTLWKVNDRRTAELIGSFHGYLKVGKTKDEALRRAKLDFLNANSDQFDSLHPFFWAGFIGIGDMRALETAQH